MGSKRLTARAVRKRRCRRTSIDALLPCADTASNPKLKQRRRQMRRRQFANLTIRAGSAFATNWPIWTSCVSRSLAAYSLIRVVATAIFAFCLSDCTAVTTRKTAQESASAKTCINEVRSTPEGQTVYARIWSDDDTDTSAKLADYDPITNTELAALSIVHNRMQRCKQIIMDHDTRYATWELPYWEDYFQRSDTIFYKLIRREISVGLANKLAIESNGKFQDDVSIGHMEALRAEDIQRQRAAESLLQESTQLLAKRPKSQKPTTNCLWVGNNLKCDSR